MREMLGLARLYLTVRVVFEGLVFLALLGSLVILLWLLSA